jgi:hypothetical protein
MSDCNNDPKCPKCHPETLMVNPEGWLKVDHLPVKKLEDDARALMEFIAIEDRKHEGLEAMMARLGRKP